jgi:RHS repeat-associated protein
MPTRVIRSGEAVVRRGAASTDLSVTGVAVGLPPSSPVSSLRVRAETFDDDAASRLGVEGPAVRLSHADDERSVRELVVDVDLAPFIAAFDGTWADRVQALWFGPCGRLDRAGCRPQPLPMELDQGSGTARVTVPVGGLPSDAGITAAGEESGGSSQVLAFSATTAGANGSYSATPLSPYGQWSVGLQGGSFSWSYPLPSPPSPVGPLVDLSLDYSSGSVDGMTAEASAQAGAAGLGWELSGAGFIERRYRPCSLDGGISGDLCWARDELVLSLGGFVSDLAPTSDPHTFRPERDPNWVVHRYFGAAGSPDNDGEHWVVRTPDGTEYRFGTQHNPWVGTIPSVWTVPVTANNPGEPCYNGTPSGWCQQGWRFNLDQVSDTNGNYTRLWWAREQNLYGRGGQPYNPVAYTRGGYLEAVDVGANAPAGAGVTGRTLIGVADRCVQGSGCPAPVPANASSYPDVPLDLVCSQAPCWEYSPSFFTTKRLASVTTQALSWIVWDDVDRIDLTHDLPDNGYGERRLWLRTIQRTGRSGPGASVSLPPVQFDSLSSNLPNRADGGGSVSRAYMFRLDSIINELGGVLRVAYGQPHPCSPLPTGAWDTNVKDCFPAWSTPSAGPAGFVAFNKYLVVSTLEQDPVGGAPQVLTTYGYEDTPAWHHMNDRILPDRNDPFGNPNMQSWSDWRGHGTVVATVDPFAGSSASRTRYRYYRGMDGDRLANGTYKSVQVAAFDGSYPAADSNWFAGQLLHLSRVDAFGVEHWGQVTTPAMVVTAFVAPLAALHTYIERTETRHRGPNAPGLNHQLYRSLNANLAPSTETEYVWASGSPAVAERCTSYSYASAPASAPWRTGHVAERRVHDGFCSGPVVAHQQYRYDGQPVGTLGSGAANVTHERTLADAQLSHWLEVRASHDGYGRVLQSWDARNQSSVTSFSPSVGMPTSMSITNAASHPTMSTMEIERGAVVEVIDPNANRRTFTHDSLGRLVEVRLPDPANGSQTVLGWQFLYGIDPAKQKPSIVWTVQATSASPLVSFALNDGLGRQREIQRIPPAPHAGRIVTATTYDSHGRVATETAPFADPAPVNGWLTSTASAPATVYTHDVFDRVVREAFVAGGGEQWATTTSYSGWNVSTVTPPNGGGARSTIDALGRLVLVEDLLPGGAVDASSAYTYDDLDRVLSRTSTGGGSTVSTYDLAGRQRTMVDADLGAWAFTYDDNGNQVTSRDPRNTTVTTTYDSLNRPRTRAQGSTLLAEWTYDTAPEGIGLPAETRAHDSAGTWVSRVDSYDHRGRPTSHSTFVPDLDPGPGVGSGGTYRSTQAYDLADRPTVFAFPGDAAGGLGETVTTNYENALGVPHSLGSSLLGGTVAYVHDTTLDPIGRVVGRKLPTASAQVVNRTWEFNTATQRLHRLAATRDPGGGLPAVGVQDLVYSYRPDGNLVAVADGLAGQRTCYGYDGRRRLDSAFTQTSAAGCEAGYGSGAGPDPFQQTFTYAPDGFLTQATTTIGGAPPVTRSFGRDPNHPHAVGTAGGDGFGYDPAGNQISRTVGGVTATLAYDPMSRLVSVGSGSGSSFSYWPDGSRVRRTAGATTTLYLGPLEITSDGTPAGTTWVRSYQIAGATVGVRRSSNGTDLGVYQVLLGDHQGSGTVAVNGAGTAFTQRYLPYGQIRGGGPNGLPTEQTYTGQTTDEATGLMYYGARYYDPAIMAFTQPDTILPGAGSLAHNRYHYTFGDPVNHTDPSGHIPCPDGMCNRNGTTSSVGRRRIEQRESAAAVAASRQWIVDQGVSAYLGEASSELLAFHRLNNRCDEHRPDMCVAAFSLTLGYSIEYAEALADGGACLTYRVCDGGGAIRDRVAEFLLIDLPVGFLTGAAVRTLASTLSVGTSEAVVSGGYVASKIEITEAGLQHVLDRHIIGGALSTGKSLFDDNVTVTRLIADAADAVPPIAQVNGNHAYIVDAGRTIGVDRATGAATRIYTVIARPNGELVTAFPGVP